MLIFCSVVHVNVCALWLRNSMDTPWGGHMQAGPFDCFRFMQGSFRRILVTNDIALRLFRKKMQTAVFSAKNY